MRTLQPSVLPLFSGRVGTHRPVVRAFPCRGYQLWFPPFFFFYFVWRTARRTPAWNFGFQFSLQWFQMKYSTLHIYRTLKRNPRLVFNQSTRTKREVERSSGLLQRTWNGSPGSFRSENTAPDSQVRGRATHIELWPRDGCKQRTDTAVIWADSPFFNETIQCWYQSEGREQLHQSSGE